MKRQPALSTGGDVTATPRTKRCQSCGVVFVAQRDAATYCSGRCRVRETRKRARGAPDALTARRTPTGASPGGPLATTPAGATPRATPRLVTLRLDAETSIEVTSEIAAALAAHLPVPGETQPWGQDVRSRSARQREEGIAAALAEQQERDQAAAAPPAPPATPPADDLDQLDQLDPDAPVPLDPLPPPTPPAGADDSAPAGEPPRDWKRITPNAWGEYPQSVAADTRRALEESSVLATPLGRNAMVLARRIDNADNESASALASVSRQFAATYLLATQNHKAATAAPVDDKLAAARAARLARRSAAQSTSNTGPS